MSISKGVLLDGASKDGESNHIIDDNHLFSHKGTCGSMDAQELVNKVRFDSKKLDYFHNKLENCGDKKYDVIKKEDSSVFTVPVFCDNRACSSSKCQRHRGSKFRKEHYVQQEVVKQSMNQPKSWVFTGWRVDMFNPFEFRKFASGKMSKLYKVLSNSKFGCSTEFSIHMELKFNTDGTVYLHFHVVAGGIKCRLSAMSSPSLWGRVVRYETAISAENVDSYVSKYASKTPYFHCSENVRDWYHLVVHKLYMHRYSVSKTDAERCEGAPVKPVSSCYLYSMIIFEAKSSFFRDSYKNHLRASSKGRGVVKNRHHVLLEPSAVPYYSHEELLGILYQSLALPPLENLDDSLDLNYPLENDEVSPKNFEVFYEVVRDE